MAPPEWHQTSSLLASEYKTAGRGAIIRHRKDSPFSHSSPEVSDPEMAGSRRSSVTVSGFASSSTSPEHASMASGQTCVRKRRSRTSSSNDSTRLRFVVVDDPKKLKDRDQLRQSRKHVMLDYLDKERRNPGSTDIRVTKSSANARKRKRVGSSLSSITSNPSLPVSISPPHGLSTSPGQIVDRSRDVSELANSIESSEIVLCKSDQLSCMTTIHKPSETRLSLLQDNRPLVRGIEGDINNTRYMRTYLDHFPSPVSSVNVGSSLQPFNCWPTLADPSLSVEELKWSCSRKFGSESIGKNWIPSLLKAKHAFLSTICISASHDDIMMRAQQAPHERSAYGSMVRMRVRSEVLGLINKALANPETCSTDETLISVLHVLNSEIMGCDDAIMRIHQNGLHELVVQRGGLHKLGVDGQLGLILTITMYMISALRETEPHGDFVRYAAERRRKPRNNVNQLPESPLYCRPSGYLTLKRKLQTKSPTFALLEDLRQLTHAFVRATGNVHVSPLTPMNATLPWKTNTSTVSSLRDKIFALPSADSQPMSFSTPNEKYTFEALRLLALVYAHALATETPFSKAAAQLSATTPNAPLAWHIRIKNALMRTDLSDCWGHLAGVLHFITLIAGACANPDSHITLQGKRRASRRSSLSDDRSAIDIEEEEARKWLAAISVRCSVLLSFEYGGEILEMLRRLVGIEKVLANAAEERERAAGRHSAVAAAWWEGSDAVGTSSVFFGPAREPFEQRTFADFAADFMDESV